MTKPRKADENGHAYPRLAKPLRTVDDNESLVWPPNAIYGADGALDYASYGEERIITVDWTPPPAECPARCYVHRRRWPHIVCTADPDELPDYYFTSRGICLDCLLWRLYGPADEEAERQKQKEESGLG